MVYASETLGARRSGGSYLRDVLTTDEAPPAEPRNWHWAWASQIGDLAHAYLAATPIHRVNGETHLGKLDPDSLPPGLAAVTPAPWDVTSPAATPVGPERLRGQGSPPGCHPGPRTRHPSGITRRRSKTPDRGQRSPVDAASLLLVWRRRRQHQASIYADEQLRPHVRSSLPWVGPLPGLRAIHHAAWLARWWRAPTFSETRPRLGPRQYRERATMDLEDIVRETCFGETALQPAESEPDSPPLTNNDSLWAMND